MKSADDREIDEVILDSFGEQDEPEMMTPMRLNAKPKTDLKPCRGSMKRERSPRT